VGAGIEGQASLGRAGLAQPEKTKDKEDDDNQADNVDDLIHGRPYIAGCIAL